MSALIQALPAFKDNYIWVIYDPELGTGICIDPGEAQPVKRFFEQQKLTLTHILITHHHWDHTNGVKALVEAFQPTVIGPSGENIKALTNPVKQGDEVRLSDHGLLFYVIDTPGHTLGHIAYYGHGILFCGDTLFTGGCGRLFEGTPEQMVNSLDKFLQLPKSTLVYCAHEYTINNLRFAEMVEPDNAAIADRLQEATQLRKQSAPTVPASLEVECATNPFLRTDQPGVIAAAERHSGRSLATPVEVFAALRQWKDNV